MRTVRIPADVELQADPALSLSFAAFLVRDVLDAIPLTDAATVTNVLGLSMKLPEEFPGAQVELTDAEHELLAKTMAGMRFRPGMKARLLPFFAAVHGVPDPRA